MTDIEREFRAGCIRVGERLRIHKPQFVLNRGQIVIGDDVEWCGTSDILFGNIETLQPLLKVGDHSYIGNGCSLRIARSVTIGRYCLISDGVRLQDFDGHPMDAIARRTQATPPEGIGAIVIGDDVWIGNDALVLKGVTIGDRAVVAAMAVVATDVPPDTLVAGNPARVVRSLNGRSVLAPHQPPATASAADRVKWAVAEQAGLLPADVDLTHWADAYNIDSLRLLLLRESLEAHLGVRFSDARWVSFRSFQEVVDSCGVASRPSAAPAPAVVRDEGPPSITRDDVLCSDIEIGMPLTGRNHLAEGPLLEILGDLRWKQMSQLSGVPAGQILDDEGQRLYATFVYAELSFSEERPMAAFRLNDRVRAECHLRRHGTSVLDGVFHLRPSADDALASADARPPAPRARLTNVFARQHNGAEWLRKSRPADRGFERIPVLDGPPDSLERVRQASAEGRFGAPPAGYQPMRDRPAQVRYALVPDRDLNAAGLVYFAHYPVFLDIAEREALRGAEVPLAEDLIDLRTVIGRRSAYLNNAHAHDTLLIEVEPWVRLPTPGHPSRWKLWVNFRMYRESDRRLMMVSTVDKLIDGGSR